MASRRRPPTPSAALLRDGSPPAPSSDCRLAAFRRDLPRAHDSAQELAVVLQQCEWSPHQGVAATLVLAARGARDLVGLTREEFLTVASDVYAERVRYVAGVPSTDFDDE